MRALVTGCAGFIGSHLVDSLLDGGAEVRGVDCLTENYGRAEKLRNLQQAQDWSTFSFTELDLAATELVGLVDAADVVFHLAAEPGVRSSWGSRFDVYVRNNVLATQRLLEALKARPAKRLVFASSSSVYGQAERLPTLESATPRPLSPYGVTKLAAEHLVHLYAANYGLEAVTLRYFSVYGPRQRPDMAFHRFFRAAIERVPLTIFGNGSQRRDFTFISDVVSGTINAANSRAAVGGVYNIGGGSQLSVGSAVDLIAKLVGRPLEVRYLTPQRGDVHATGASIEHAHRDLGYQPSVVVEGGLRAQFEWLCSSAEDHEPALKARA